MRPPPPDVTRWLAGWPRPTSLTVDVVAAGTNPDTGEPAGTTRDGADLAAGRWSAYSLRADQVSTDSTAIVPTDTPGDSGALRLTIALSKTPATVPPDRLAIRWTPDGAGAEPQHVADVQLSTVPPLTSAMAAAAGFAVDASAPRMIIARDIAVAEAQECTQRIMAADLVEILMTPGRYLLPPNLDAQQIVRIEPLDGSAHITAPTKIPTIDTGIAAVCPTPDRPWPTSGARIVVECGMPAIPPDLAEAMARRWRHWAAAPESAVPSQATSYSVEGTTYRLTTAGRRRTGDQTVDAVYARHRSAMM